MNIPKVFGLKGIGIALSVGFLLGSCSTWKLRDMMAAEAKLKAARAETRQAGQVIQKIVRADAITQKVGGQSAERVEVIRWRTRTITEKVNVYVSSASDDRCVIPAGFVRVHDGAASGSALPQPSGQSDDAPSGVDLSAVAGTVAVNYGLYHETAERLKALQDWVRQQQGAQ